MGRKGVIYDYSDDMAATGSGPPHHLNGTGSSLASPVIGQCFQISTPLWPSPIPK